MLIENVKFQTHTHAVLFVKAEITFSDSTNRGTFDATTYEWNPYVGRCGCGFEFVGCSGWRLCCSGYGVQHMSAEDERSTRDLLPTSTVQRVACTNYKAGLSDKSFRDVLFPAVPKKILSNCETRRAGAEGNVLLAKTGDLCGPARCGRVASSVRQSEGCTRATN